MAALHALAVHFPIALLNIAFVLIIWRMVSDGALARALEKAIVPLIALGLLGGLVAFVIGLLVWPISAATASPLGRNHILWASWTLAYWTVLGVWIWQLGARAWRGVERWVLLLLALIGVGVLTVAGTLGGSLAGKPTAISALVSALFWEVYSTLYVPDISLWVLVVLSAALLAVVYWARRRVAD